MRVHSGISWIAMIENIAAATVALSPPGTYHSDSEENFRSERMIPMVLGMPLSTFTFIHVLISVIGIGAGLIVVYGFFTRKMLNGINAIFLATTILTSLTGFLFPFTKLLPSHILGVLSLIALAIAMVARYQRRLQGGWRATYVVNAIVALYFNVFVLVVQLFEKVPAIHALAPTQTEPPFAVVQGLTLVLFVVLGIFAVKKFRTAAAREAAPAWTKTKAS